jgi:hypothetical protein
MATCADPVRFAPPRARRASLRADELRIDPAVAAR